MKTSVSSKGQIVLPAEIRRRDGIEPGQEFEVERIDRGEYRLICLSPPKNQSLLEWLLACPEKDFFVPIESEGSQVVTRNRRDFEKAEIIDPFA
jgi:AbrB family looped-hinge helix DNA binding protein